MAAIRMVAIKRAVRKPTRLLVDPGCLVGLPADQLLRLEPEGNLLLGRLHSVGSMADVTTNLNKSWFSTS